MKCFSIALGVLLLIACEPGGDVCDDGFALGADGNCYEVTDANTKTASGDDDDATGDTTETTETTETTGNDLLTRQEFSEAFGDLLCAEYALCNPDIDCISDPQPGDAAGCDFDPIAAAACLAGEYICNDEFGEGFEFVETPPACAEVFTNCD